MTKAPRRSRLVALVQRFVEADSWAASRAFLERHTALLSDEADDVLTDLHAVASARGDSAAAGIFKSHQAVLRRYRELGAAAFDELIAPGVPTTLRPGWLAAEAAYERYRARPSRAAADAAVHAVMAVLRHDGFAAVPAAARAGMHQAAGTLLGERFQRHGGPVADLDAAVSCFTAAVRELADDAPDRPSYASALGNVLGMRYEERGDPADLDAGIRWSREAAAGMPAEERWWLLHNLSANLGIRYEMLGSPADLAEALDAARDAYAGALRRDDPAAPRTALMRSGMGTIEVALASLEVPSFGFDSAVSDLAAAVKAGSANLRIRAFLLTNLAAGRQARHRRTGRPEDLEAGVSAYRDACQDALTYDLEVALNAALDWGDWAVSRASWTEASRAYIVAFEAAGRLWRHQLGRAEKEIWLGAARQLGEQAGLAAARAGQLDRAAVCMERGRAQLLTESLSLGRLDLARLAAVNPGLAGRYAAAADRLRSLDAAARDERSGQAVSGYTSRFADGHGRP